MLRTCRLSLVAAAFAAPLALAETDPATEVDDDAPFLVQTATCDDIFGLVEEATPEAGKDPK